MVLHRTLDLEDEMPPQAQEGSFNQVSSSYQQPNFFFGNHISNTIEILVQSLEEKDWKNVKQPEFMAATNESHLNISKQISRQPENYVSQDIVLAQGTNMPKDQPVASRAKGLNYMN